MHTTWCFSVSILPFLSRCGLIMLLLQLTFISLKKALEVLKLPPSLQTLNNFPYRLSDRNHRVRPILATESLQVFLRPKLKYRWVARYSLCLHFPYHFFSSVSFTITVQVFSAFGFIHTVFAFLTLSNYCFIALFDSVHENRWPFHKLRINMSLSLINVTHICVI